MNDTNNFTVKVGIFFSKISNKSQNLKVCEVNITSLDIAKSTHTWENCQYAELFAVNISFDNRLLIILETI